MSTDLNILLKKLGENIVRLRAEKGLTQAILADEIEMDRANLRRIEAGRTNPGVSTLYRISNSLQVDLKDLFDFEQR